MKPPRSHRPGRPLTDDPPAALDGVVAGVRHPLVRQTGVTTTRGGEWAVFVTVPKNTTVPIPAVEQQAGGFPVVYEAEPDHPPIARPASP